MAAAAAAAAASLLSPLGPSPPTTSLFRRPYLGPIRQKPRLLSSSSFRNGSTPETECPVPLEQQPVNEYQALSTSLLFSWAAGDLGRYCSRLAFTGAAFALFVGLPVAAFGRGYAADPQIDALRCVLGAASTGLLAVTLAVLRMYLGWAYVGNRLLSATVEYEETGWYDGQEEVYMRPLPGCDSRGKVCRPKKALYGLKQSPRTLFDRFRLAMGHFGYT